MLRKTVGYCVAYGHGAVISHVFLEDYDDAVEALREFVMELSELEDAEVEAMNGIQLMNEIDVIDGWTEEFTWGYIFPIRFKQN